MDKPNVPPVLTVIVDHPNTMEENPNSHSAGAKTTPLQYNRLGLGLAGISMSQKVNPAYCWAGMSSGPFSSPNNVATAVQVTPTSTAEESQSTSTPPEGSRDDIRPTPPFPLSRQPSQNTAWLSEIDSHYHSDREDDSSWDGATPQSAHRSDYDLDSDVPPKPPSIIAAAVTPLQSISKAFVNMTSSNGQTTETVSNRARYRRKQSTKTAAPAETNSAVLTIYQERLEQAEKQKNTLSQRLAVAERSHREVAEDLRDAQWETTRLQELLGEQRVKIAQLEEQQRITQEWQSSQEKSVLVDSLKKAQDKLIGIEEQKLRILSELASLRKKAAADATLFSDLQREKEELVVNFDRLDSQVDLLQTVKEELEAKLSASLAKQQAVETIVTTTRGDLQRQQAENKVLEETNQTLRKRVRFATEQLEDAERKNSELEIRMGFVETESQRLTQEFSVKTNTLESSLKVLQIEKQDLYDSWQKSLEAQRMTQSELERSQIESAEDKGRLQRISVELEKALVAKKELEALYQVKLQEQSNLLAQAEDKMEKQKKEYETRLAETLKEVMDMQQVIEQSGSQIASLQTERVNLLADQQSLQAKLQVNQARFDDIDAERLFFKHALEEMQVEQAHFQNQSEQLHLDLQSKLQAVEAETVSRQVEALKERRTLEQELEQQTSLVHELEAKVDELEQQRETFDREKEELVQKAADLQAILLDEGPKKALQAMEADRDRLKDVVQSLHDAQLALQEEIKLTTSKAADLEVKLGEALARHAPLEQQAHAAAERATCLEKQLSQARSEAYDLQATHQQLLMEHQKKLTDRQKSESKIEELEKSAKHAEGTIRALEDSSQELRLRIDDLNTSKTALAEKLEETQALITTLETTHISARTALETDLSASNDEVANLQNVTAALESKIGDLQEKFKSDMAAVSAAGKAELDTSLAKIAALQLSSEKELEKLQCELVSKREELDRNQSALEVAHSKLSESAVALDSARRENDSLVARLEASTSSVESLGQQLSSSMSEIERLAAERDVLMLVRSDLQSTLGEAEATAKALSSEKEDWHQKLLEVLDQNRVRVSKLEDALKARESLEAQLQESTEQNAALEERSKEMAAEIASLRGVGSDLRKNVEDLRQERIQLTSSRDALVAEYESMQTSYDQKLLELSTKVNSAESVKAESLSQLQVLQALLKILESEKSAASARLTEIEGALSIAESLLSKARQDLSAATQERDAALCEQSNILKQCSELQICLEKTRRDMEETMVENTKLRTEKSVLSEKLKRVENDFSELQESNRNVLSRHAELEDTEKQLRNEVASLQTQKLELVAFFEEQTNSTAEQMSVLSKENEDLREQLDVLETIKAQNVGELSSARDTISRLESKIKAIEQETQRAAVDRATIAEDMSRLSEDKVILQQEATKMSQELNAIRAELLALEASARTAETKLAEAEGDKAQLANEKCDAVARQSQLVAELHSSRSAITSLEDEARHLEDEIRALEAAKQSLASEERKALSLLGAAKEKEQRLIIALAESERTIEDLKTENSNIASRVTTAEASLSVLQGDVEHARKTGCVAVKHLGKMVKESNETVKALSGELKASEQTKKALKRAAKYLIKRVRELEEQAGKKELPLVFSCDLSPSSGRRDLKCVSPDSQEKKILRPNDDGKLLAYDVIAYYTGPLVNGLPHGPGMLRFGDKEMVLAEFEHGEICGVAAFSDRQRYHHANMVVFGKFEGDRSAGIADDIRPIERVTVRSSSHR